jgi:hypothetical protein
MEAEVIASVGDFVLVRQPGNNDLTLASDLMRFPTDLILPRVPKIPRRKVSPMKGPQSADENSPSAASEIRSKVLFQVDAKPHLDFKHPKNVFFKHDKSKEGKKDKTKEAHSQRRSSLPEDLVESDEKKVKLGEVTNISGHSAQPSTNLPLHKSGHLRDAPDAYQKGTPLRKTNSLKTRF